MKSYQGVVVPLDFAQVVAVRPLVTATATVSTTAAVAATISTESAAKAFGSTAASTSKSI